MTKEETVLLLCGFSIQQVAENTEEENRRLYLTLLLSGVDEDKVKSIEEAFDQVENLKRMMNISNTTY
jgi:hypothetical protein